MTEQSTAKPAEKWLLLVHQLPAKPAYLRVKIWRQLRDLGAVALKGSHYALPDQEDTEQAFRRVVREIRRSGGEAALCRAEFVDGMRANEVRGLFNAARDADYEVIAEELRKIQQLAKRKGARQADIRGKLTKAGARFVEVARIDFFQASGRRPVERLLSSIEHGFIVREGGEPSQRGPVELLRRTWVTRTDIHVDRIACAWLVRRFIDPDAQFKFVARKKYSPVPGELRFDMAGAEFTHEDDMCSFEVLLRRLNKPDTALRAIAEIVHELDIKDGKFQRDDIQDVGRAVDDICIAQRTDTARIAHGSELFDALYRRIKGGP